MAADDIYQERRADRINDQRLMRVENKVDALAAKLNWMAGGLAVLSLIMNIVGPIIVEKLAR